LAANTLLAQALAPRVRVCGVAPGVTLLVDGGVSISINCSACRA
jgi:hypothetical protein